MQVNPYLSFDGTCEAAFKFYEQCLGGKIQGMSTFAGTPAESHVPAEWRDKILHAYMTIGDHELMGSDGMPGQYESPRGIHVTLQIKDADEAERVFHALGEDGTIQMPIAKTFWAERFGMLVDKFGIPWMINSAGAK